MARIKDIANKLGISISTVSKGLNGASDISEELRQTVLDTAVEMGYTTKKMKKEEHKLSNPYIQDVLQGRLPYTIGGGIGQSRLCMFFLKKHHIGEVQASIWTKEDLEALASSNIHLL